jgi:predicted dehydrogenase
MSERKRYAIVGTGGRAGMFFMAITSTYVEVAEIVAFCDLSQIRMNWYNCQLAEIPGLNSVPTYKAEKFDQMIAETKPDIVIVTTIDCTHHIYITRAMELGCDVISEKPMTTDLPKLQAIFSAIEKTGRSLRVTFNYRYAPAYTRFRQLVIEGAVGRPLAVDFSWILDTSHGADYFRRWHREKHNSGGLLVHKATHHFDLVNWWIDSYPTKVFAMGALNFYGKENAAGRGENYSYTRYTGIPEAENDPFALLLTSKEALGSLYMEAETETGYIRDRNVFGEPITIEDTMAVTARYQNGVLLSYCLVAYSPWEGLRVAITGTKGRIEMDIEESITHLLGDGQVSSSKGPFKQSRIRVFPMFKSGYEVEVPSGDGGHGGADPVMLEQIFSPTPPFDPYHRAASHIEGAASVLVGIAANQSMQTGQMVYMDDLFPLSSMMER